jgi:hypothetical protein
MAISSFVYLSHQACFGALLNLRTHTNPLMVVNTCAMLRNTRKATLNRIGTQRKKRATKVVQVIPMQMLGGVKTHDLR